MKNVLITGGNSGLGFETAKKIASAGDFRVILACRSRSKAEEAKVKIVEESGNENVVTMELDNADLESVRRCADEYAHADYGKLYALLCNAGISGSHDGFTDDGFDVIFQTNHLAHFLLTNLLLPHMADDGLIFATSSDMHDSPMKKMEWPGAEALAHPTGGLINDNIRYSFSKLCNLYFIYRLADNLASEGSGIKANAFNPGMMETNFMPVSKMQKMLVKKKMPDRYGDLNDSSTAYARLVSEDGLVREGGLYYDRSINTKKSSDLSYNKENAAELWQKSLEFTGLK